VDPIAVLATAAFLPGLNRSDLAFFTERGNEIDAWMAAIPTSAKLADADDQLLADLDSLADWPG